MLTSSIAPEEEVSPRSCAMKERKCTKKYDIRAKFFCFANLLLFSLSHLSETRSFISYWSILLSKNRTWFISLVPEICLKNRFRVAARLLSNRSQMTLKCGKNNEVSHEWVTDVTHETRDDVS